jgi:hypothetical protein
MRTNKGKSSLRGAAFAALLLAAGAALLAASPAAAQSGPYSFYPITPCRLIDTRNANGPLGGPALVGNQTRSFPIRNQGTCAVPATATAIVANLTAVGPTDNGNFVIYPFNTPLLLNTSVLNWQLPDWATANGSIVPLGASGLANDISVYPNMPAGTGKWVHFVLDIAGYFQP